MGRITVFSLAGCRHCKRAKALLTARGWDFLDISLSDYPEMRAPMLQLADALTVPQIFFNEVHLGGAAELEALEAAAGDELGALYEQMAGAPTPTDPRLSKPTRKVEVCTCVRVVLAREGGD
jgi:glutaredoxin